MIDKFDLGLKRPIQDEKENAIKYLNKTTSNKYKDILFHLIDCAYDIQLNKGLDNEHIVIFENGMRQASELVFDSYSGKFICKLSHHFSEIKQVFVRMADDKSSKVRFNVVTLLLNKPTDEIIEYVIKKCINDKSSKVRSKVADVCQRLNYVKSLNLLMTQLDIEEGKGVRESLLFSISLLKDGYILDKIQDNRYELLVKTSNGLTGITLNNEKIEKYSIERIVNIIHEGGRLP